MQATQTVPRTFAKMVAAAGFDEIDPEVIDLIGGRPTTYHIGNVHVRRDRYVVPEIECRPVMVNGREHAYQPFGEAKRRRAHLEEVLAYAARPEAEFPEGFTVLSEIRENFLVMCVRDGRKKLLLMSDSQLFEWPMQSIHLAVDHPEDDLYGQDEDVVMDDTIACYALVVPEIPPPPRPCHGPVYAPVVSEDYW